MINFVFNDSEDARDPGLHEAIAANNLHQVQKLLLDGVDFKYIGNWGCTALEYATELGFLDIVKILLEAGSAPDSGVNTTPLGLAIETRRLDIVQVLINAGASQELGEGHTALMEAAIANDIDIMQFLIDKGANINALREDGASALTCAARLGHLKVFNYLAPKSLPKIQKEAFSLLPDGLIYRSRKNDELTERFILACGEGNIHIIREAILAGVDINAIDSEGNTSLSFAAYWGQTDVVHLLIEAGAELELKDEQNGWTPLIAAIHLGHAEIVKVLIQAGANIHVLYKEQTTLMYAINRAFEATNIISYLLPQNCLLYLKIIKKLIKAGVDVNAKNPEGKTALAIAKQQKKIEIVKILIDAGAQES